VSGLPTIGQAPSRRPPHRREQPAAPAGSARRFALTRGRRSLAAPRERSRTLRVLPSRATLLTCALTVSWRSREIPNAATGPWRAPCGHSLPAEVAPAPPLGPVASARAVR